MRYRHLRRTVIAVLATVAFVLLFGLLTRAALNAGPTRRTAIRWIEGIARGYGAELEVDDIQWGLLPPGFRLQGARILGVGFSAEIESLQVDLARMWLARRTIELGTVAAGGVRLSLDGLPSSGARSERPIRIRVRNLELADVQFEGVNLPGSLSLNLEGLRAGWTAQEGASQGFAEVASATFQIGRMAPVEAEIAARYRLTGDSLTIANFRLQSSGFSLAGTGSVAAGGAVIEAAGPLDIGWLDGLIKSNGLLDGRARVRLGFDTSAPELLRAEVDAPHVDVAGFPLDDVRGTLALQGGSLHGDLDSARFHGGIVSGTYHLAELGGRFPHRVEAQGIGIILDGLLKDLKVPSAGLAATFNADVNLAWNGRSFPNGRGHADLQLTGSPPGVTVAGPMTIDLTGDRILRFDASSLAVGSASVLWQGALAIESWEPAWSIKADGAELAEVAPMVNAWVGSEVLPTELEGSADLEVNLSGPFSDLVVAARLDARPISLPPVTFDRLVADATVAHSLLRIGSARFQIGDGFGEIEGGLTWDEAVGDEQLGLDIRGSRIPVAAAASWIGLEQWIDTGLLSFDGALEGPIGLPRGTWLAELEDLSVGGLGLGTASTTVELADGRFSCQDLRCDRGLRATLWWDVPGAEVTGNLHWPEMPLDGFGEAVTRLAGDTGDVTLDFDLPIGDELSAELSASSDQGRLRVVQRPESVEAEADVTGAFQVRTTLFRDEAGRLHGSGGVEFASANRLLELLAPGAGVPLTGSGHADFTVDWGDEPWPTVSGRVTELDLQLADQPVRLIEPALFDLSSRGFDVPGLRLRAREDELFVRWLIDADGGLTGNVSGTMDTLLLRFLLPEWEPAGRATGVVEILGTIDVPLFEGIAEIHRGSFRLPGTRTILSQVQGVVLLSSGEVELEGMNFRFMGGRGLANGAIRQRNDSLFLALDGTARGVRFEVFPSLEARVSGTWSLSGPVEQLSLSGDLAVDRMNLTTKDDPTALLISWMGAADRPAADGGLNLNLHVEAEETLNLRNPFVRLVGSASLDVSGTSNRPGLVGQVEVLDGGEVTLFGNRYEVERGSLTFSNPLAVDPFIDIQASTWAQEYQISVNLSGTLDRFVSTAVSTPPLSAPEIYSLLGVGYRSEALGSSAMGLGLASSILSSELTSVLSQRARLVLPVDQVRVDPFAADSTGNPTARLSVVKQLTPSWTVILQTTLSGEREQIVTSRWYLAPGLFLEAGQHDDGSFSLDLKLRRPY